MGEGGYEMNRMELNGPNRESIRKILNKDRQIVAHIVMTSAMNVLEKKFGWKSEQLQEFNGYLLEEIKKS